MSHAPEVIVVGGGPAGATAARLLARWGHRVVLVTRPRRSVIAESLPPSSRKVLRHIGLEGQLEEAGCFANTGNTVWWAGEQRVEPFPESQHGFHLRSSDFDDLLCRWAERGGVDVRRRHQALSIESREDGSGDWVVQLAHGEQHSSLRSPWVLDATGRSGLLGRGFREPIQERVATLALFATWQRRGGWPAIEPGHTLVESYQDGWAWSVPLSASERFVAVMADPRATSLHGHDRTALFSGELVKAWRLSAALEGAQKVGAVEACDASAYQAARYGGEGFLLLGDAGNALDPLSSFGVKKALASGWLGAVCVHSALSAPEMAAAAVAFFEARERAVAARYHRLSAEYSQQVARHHRHRFWWQRSGDLEAADASEDLTGAAEDWDANALRDEPAVREAFAWLRSCEQLDLRIGDRARLEPRLEIQGNRLVRTEQVVTEEGWQPVRTLRGVVLPELLRRAPEHRSVPDLFESYVVEIGPVELADFLGCLAVCVARGLLVRSD